MKVTSVCEYYDVTEGAVRWKVTLSGGLSAVVKEDPKLHVGDEVELGLKAQA